MAANLNQPGVKIGLLVGSACTAWRYIDEVNAAVFSELVSVLTMLIRSLALAVHEELKTFVSLSLKY